MFKKYFKYKGELNLFELNFTVRIYKIICG